MDATFINVFSISVDAVMVASFLGFIKYHINKICKLEAIIEEKISKKEVQEMVASEFKLVNYQLSEIKTLLSQITRFSLKENV